MSSHHWSEGQLKAGLVFLLQSTSISHFSRTVLKLFSDYFHWEQNETGKNWWRKCQSSEGTSVPVNIQIWAWHSSLLFPNLHTASFAASVPCLWLKTENTLIFLEKKKEIILFKVYSYLYFSVNRCGLGKVVLSDSLCSFTRWSYWEISLVGLHVMVVSLQGGLSDFVFSWFSLKWPCWVWLCGGLLRVVSLEQAYQ